MGSKERREREKEEMRNKILVSAMKLFVEEGFENVKIRKITDQIEYSPGTFYLYFKDKNDILYHLHEEGFKLLLKRKRELLHIKDPLERLISIGKVYIDFAIENPEYYEIMFILKAPMEQVKNGEWKSGKSTFEILTTTVQECIDKGELSIKDAWLGSMLMWSIVHGFVSLIIRDRLKMVPEDEVKNLIVGFKDELRNLIINKI